MGIPLLLNEGLQKEVKSNILNKAYNSDELNEIYNSIIFTQKTSKGAFIIDALILFLVLAYITYQMSSGFEDLILATIVIASISYIICLLFIGYSLFKRTEKQFLKAIKKAYPELINEFN